MNEDEELIFYYLIKLGVGRDRAGELATQLAESLPDMAGWDESTTRDYLRYIQQWANVAIEEENQARYAMYGAYYDPRTGQPRDWGEQQRIQAMQAEGVHAQAQGRVRAQQAAGRERAWYEGVSQRYGEMPTYAQQTAPALEQMRGIPAMRGYYERELPGLYQEAGMPAARRRWWEEKTKYLPEVAGAAGGPMTPEERFEAEAGRTLWEEEMERKRTMKDPWKGWLSKLKPLERWKSLTRRERGGPYPSTFRPRTRFL